MCRIFFCLGLSSRLVSRYTQGLLLLKFCLDTTPSFQQSLPDKINFPLPFLNACINHTITLLQELHSGALISVKKKKTKKKKKIVGETANSVQIEVPS